jgi:hypothetical protein
MPKSKPQEAWPTPLRRRPGGPRRGASATPIHHSADSLPGLPAHCAAALDGKGAARMGTKHASPLAMPERPEFIAAPLVAIPSEPPARLILDQPLPEQLAKGLVVIRYRTENLRIVPIFGSAALAVSPRLGHLHITVDDAPWHWVDASGEPLIVQSLLPGAHSILVELADPVHAVIDRARVAFEIPRRPGLHH